MAIEPGQFGDDYRALADYTYRNVLGRTGDIEQSGLDYWTNALSTGQVRPQDLASIFAATPEGIAAQDALVMRGVGGSGVPSGTSPQETLGQTGYGTVAGGATTPDYLSLVKQAYGTELGRTGDIEQSGLDYWSNLLSTGKITPDQLGQLFSKTPEGLKYDIQSLQGGAPGVAGNYVASDLSKYLDAVNKQYQSELYRQGEVDGLTYWTDLLMQGKLKEGDLAKAIGTSPEARVQDAFQTVFGRQAGSADMEKYYGLLNSGQMTYPQLVQALKNTEEYKKLHPTTTTITGATTTTPGVTPPGNVVDYLNQEVAGTGFGRRFTPAEMDLYYTYGQRPEHRFYAPSAPAATTTTEENT
jgi:hypothetical protein